MKLETLTQHQLQWNIRSRNQISMVHDPCLWDKPLANYPLELNYCQLGQQSIQEVNERPNGWNMDNLKRHFSLYHSSRNSLAPNGHYSWWSPIENQSKGFIFVASSYRALKNKTNKQQHKRQQCPKQAWLPLEGNERNSTNERSSHKKRYEFSWQYCLCQIY